MSENDTKDFTKTFTPEEGGDAEHQLDGDAVKRTVVDQMFSDWSIYLRYLYAVQIFTLRDCSY